MNTTQSASTAIQETISLYQMLATGGTTGLIILFLVGIYKFLQSRRHLVSQCSRLGITLIADNSTPTASSRIVLQNIAPTVETKQDARPSDESKTPRRGARSGPPPIKEDGSGVCNSKPDQETRKENPEAGVQTG